MNSFVISLEGSQEVINKINNDLTSEEIRKSIPVQKDSLADPLDSPLGADEIKGIIEIITLIFKAGTAIAAFISVIKPILSKRPQEVIIVRNPKTGKKIGSINSNTSEDEIKKIFNNDSNIQF